MAVTLELLLMRHGQTQWNVDKRYLGHRDQSILEEARDQLIPLRGQVSGRKFNKIVCSDLKRCRESLAFVAPELLDGVVYDSRLREMDFGDWEGRTYEELKGLPLYCEWLDDPQIITPPNGEAWDLFHGRIKDFLHSLIPLASESGGDRTNPSVFIVTHGGVIRQLITMIIPQTSFWDLSVEPGSLVKVLLTLDDECWTGTLRGEY
ncbi:alpha-ribazole phosphatase [Paenibacillus sp. DS2015]|uniref:histidine phosphatase family protein n=1 Tax=Paenibacillus sp. DS2015 TaxID=3373917 RepID=UPI003D1ED5E7